MNKNLEDYLKLVIPQPLEDNEYIRLFFKIAEPKKDAPSKFVRFVQTFEEVEEMINKYKFFCNIFISLSTYKKETIFDDKPSLQYRRQVIFIDFDKKDYFDFKDAKDFSLHFKKKVSWLYNHCTVASGSGGVHFYIATEVTDNIAKITAINKTIAELSNADINAAISTQVARLPTSYNLKDKDNHVLVKVISNCVDDDRFKRYNIQALENRMRFEKENRSTEIPAQEVSRPVNCNTTKYYCVNHMLDAGCKQGERNFALGRIIAKLKKENYQKSKAMEIILDWNKRCNPPKVISEVEDDFERYWVNNDYKLLGCNLPEGRQKEILKNYCDKALCRNFQNYEMENDTENIAFINELFFSKRNVRRLNGLHYLIILMLTVSEKHRMKKYKIFKLLEKNKKNTSKVRYTKKTLMTVIQDLIDYKIVNETDNGYYELKKYNLNLVSDIKIKTTAIEAFVKKHISQTEFKIYLVLNYLLQIKCCATYDYISGYLDMEKSSISAYVNKLNEIKLIKITKVYNAKGQECNRYIFK